MNDVEQEIYLAVEDRYVPAPLYYWKVIQDQVCDIHFLSLFYIGQNLTIHKLNILVT